MAWLKQAIGSYLKLSVQLHLGRMHVVRNASVRLAKGESFFIVIAACTDSWTRFYPELPSHKADSSGEEVIRMATRKIGRSAINGRFMPVKSAQSASNRRTAIVQTIKTPKKGK